MPQYTQQELTNKISKLPQDLRDTFYSEETNEAVRGIAKKNGLALDKMGLMYEEINYVILGYNHPTDFIKKLSERLQVDPEKARAIAQDVNVAIFKPIRDSLKKVHGITDQESAVSDHVSNIKGQKTERPPATRMTTETKDMKMGQPISDIKPALPAGEKPSPLFRPEPKITPPLTTKPPPDFQSLTSKFQRVKEPADKPVTYIPETGGSFKASRSILTGEMSATKISEHISDIKNKETPEQKQLPKRDITHDSGYITQEKKSFWQKPMVENKNQEPALPAGRSKIINQPGGMREKLERELEEAKELEKWEKAGKEPSIFAKPAEMKPAEKSEDIFAGKDKPAKPSAPESAKNEPEKELNYKHGQDPYKEPIE